MTNRIKLKGGRFTKRSISIQNELWPWFVEQKNRPEHAGSLSSLIRSLAVEKMERAGLKVKVK